MNIDALLRAAEYLERKEKGIKKEVVSSTRLKGERNHFLSSVEAEEHGYASLYHPDSLPLHEKFNQQKKRLTKARKPQGNRSTHNELEKNRRAHLRECLQSLKKIVPVGSDSSRHTTLGLLNKAKHFIWSLEDKDRKVAAHKETLLREQRYLKRRLELLSSQVDAMYHKRRSLSESSSTSTVSGISESDEHEVDVIGYGGTSDDDHSSIRSGASDGGVSITTWRHLNLSE